MRVAVIDPSHQVPYYDRGLVGGLAALETEVIFVTAPLPFYDPGPPPAGVAVRLAFGRLLRAPGLRHLPVAAMPRLRRLLRGVGYGPEASAMCRWAARQRMDVVHWQWGLLPPVDARCVGRLRRSGTGTVYTVHNVLPHETRAWHATVYRHLYARPDRLVVHSEATRQRLLGLMEQGGGRGDACVAPTIAWPDGARMGRPVEASGDGIGVSRGMQMAHVTVIPMAAEVPARAPDRAAARTALGLPTDRPLALFFGHVRPYKGLDLLLDAVPALRQRVPRVLVLVAGPIAGGRRGAAALRATVADRGLGDAVILRLGYVPHAQASDHFAAAEVVALPYRAVDDSAVLATARGHGRAVVATAVGGLPEALAAGGGLLVPPGDALALADALAQVLAEDGLRDRLEAEAHAAARAWTWADAAQRHLEVYQEVIGETHIPQHRPTGLQPIDNRRW
jgi:D-inositol-3-phosphate glycosyltransferase